MRKSTVIGVVAASILMLYSRPTLSSALASDIRKSDAVQSSRQLQLHRAIGIARALQNQTTVFISTLAKSSARVQADSFGVIAGSVTANDGSVPPRAWVIAFTLDSTLTPWKGFAQVNSDGSYYIENLIANDYIVVAEAEGFLPQYYDHAASLADAKFVHVAASDTTTGINFSLEKLTPGTGVISGKVTTESGGAPIANAMINVYAKDNPFYYGYANTQSDGTYRVEGLKTAQYYVTVWANGYISEYYDNARTPDLATPVAVTEPNETANVNFALGTGGSISGIVTDEAGNPISGALIDAYFANSDSLFLIGYTTISERDGSYKISGLQAGEYLVLAYAWNQWSYAFEWYKNVSTPDLATPVPVTEGQVTTGIDFALDLPKIAGSIGGIVANLQGEPLAGVFVQATSWPYLPDSLNWRKGFLGYAYTDASGHYRIDLPADTFLVSATDYSGWQSVTRWYPDATTPDSAKPVVIRENIDLSDINFRLPIVASNGIISGKVTDEAGNPIAGAFIEAYFANFDSLLRRGSATISEKDGSYKITKLEAGKYLVLAQARNQWSYAIEWYQNASTPDSATPVPVTEDQVTTGIDFTLDLPKIAGSISGIVTSSQGAPLADVFVQATSWLSTKDSLNVTRGSASGFWGYAYTDASGHYRIDLPADTVLVSATYYSGWQSVTRWYPDATTPDSAKPVIVQKNVDLVDINFRLPIVASNSVISGKVADESGQPLVGAFIDITPPGRTDDGVWPIWAYGVTDSSGNYAIANLPAGEYIVHAQYWENYSFGEQWYQNAARREEATPVKVEESQKVGDIDFTLKLHPMYGSIYGRVTADADGSPIARAYLEISPVNRDYLRGAPIAFWNWNTTTNERGEYRLDFLPEGEYLVAVYANGAFEYFKDAVVAEQATPVKVVGGDSVSVNFGLTPRNEGTGVISGVVTDEWNNGPLPIALVIARPTATYLAWPQSEMFFTAVTNPDGSYNMAGLAPGEYYVMSFAPGYAGEYYDNVFDPNQATPVKVDGQTPEEGINFTLYPILFREKGDLDPRAGTGAGVFGKVSDTAGKGVGSAYVYVLNDNAQPIAFTRANTEGSYEINDVPPGRYRMLASHTAFSSTYNNAAKNFGDATPIELGLGKVEVNFVLDPKGTTGVKDRPASTIPKSVELYGNYPNPFNPETKIAFGLPKEMHVKIRIFTVLGEEVALLHDGVLGAGVHALSWNGRNHAGREASSGLYFYRLESATVTFRGKMLLMR
jgi:protocatechuate 3,4-dioxygenase beta subunit